MHSRCTTRSDILMPLAGLFKRPGAALGCLCAERLAETKAGQQTPRVQVHPAIQVEEFDGAGLGDALGQPVVLNAQVRPFCRPTHITPNLQQQQQQSAPLSQMSHMMHFQAYTYTLLSTIVGIATSLKLHARMHPCNGWDQCM